MMPLQYLGTLHVPLNGISAFSLDLVNDSGGITAESVAAGTNVGFGVPPRQIMITAALGTNGGYTLGLQPQATGPATVTYATANALLTNLGVYEPPSKAARLDTDRYCNGVLLSGTTPTNGGASD